jgi:hypothetical protein
MSWGTFKKTLLPQMQNHSYKSISEFAKSFTFAYDLAVKSGKDPINGVPLAKGNPILMQESIIQFLEQTQKAKVITFLEVVGPAVIIYWIGGKMSKFPSPNIPVPGSIKNISTTSGIVINPGKWTSIKVPPNTNSEQFLNSFINSAKLHLTTISGTYSVIAQYPPPASPAPGIVQWKGYQIPD